jgi:hypothetical protein
MTEHERLPVSGATVAALDLDAKVRRLTEERDGAREQRDDVCELVEVVRGQLTARAESAEAEVVELRDTLGRRRDSHTQLRRDNDALRSRLAAVEALHVAEGDGDDKWCEHDGFPWPCDTVRATLAVTTGEG